MSAGLDVVGRVRRQRADDTKLSAAAAEAECARTDALCLAARRALYAAERALYAHRVSLAQASDVDALRDADVCLRAQRLVLQRLAREVQGAEAAAAAARETRDHVRARFSGDERDARAVERVLQRHEGARVRQHTMRSEVEHEDAARFRPRG